MNSPEFKSFNPHEHEIEPITELIGFSQEHNLTGEELVLAYQIAQGLTVADLGLDAPPKDEIFELAQKMDEFMKSGLAVNRLTELIQTRFDYEGFLQEFLWIGK